MSERVFLGWESPLLERLVDWLWPQRERFPELTVVVPTAQAGRRLREALALRGGCLAPRVETPGYLLRTPEAAPETAEIVAWVETLEAVADWTEFRDVFPEPPGLGEPPGWALPLARSLAGVERSLQEAAATFDSAARKLEGGIEAERWSALAALGRQKEALLESWDLPSRARRLDALVRQTPSESIVLAGVPDLPAAAKRRLERAAFTSLIAAPESLAEAFDATGCPTEEAWLKRELPWPREDAVALAANSGQVAEFALERVAAAGTASDELVLGSADDETAAELTRAFGRHGWVVHNPAGVGPSTARSWLAAWRAWLADPGAAEAVDLLGWPGTAGLAGGKRNQKVRAISAARDGWLARDRADVVRAAALATRERENLELAAETLEKLENVRAAFLRRPFDEAMADVLDRVDRDGEWRDLRDALADLAPLTRRIDREATFWLDLLARALPDRPPEIPEDRALDVNGWLELLHEPEPHLVVCGMNEGRVPAPPGNDPWLPEPVRRRLDLATDGRRAARDAYLFQALTESRKTAGRVDFLVAKTGGDGDALRPSRLLLAASGDELARRVKHLFRDLEPPDAGMKWQSNWSWTPPLDEPPARLSVTQFRDYLACPFRHYLKNVLRMSAPDPERLEWNDRDFGNAAHIILERWALDEEAREFSKTEALEQWFDAAVHRLLEERFGNRPPLAVRIQAEALRDRLAVFARLQACQYAEGWRVARTEAPFRKSLGEFELRGTIDRIDRHQDGRVRIFDYKTFNRRKPPEPEHRGELRANTALPAHLENIDAVLTHTSKRKDAYWKNLQLPLYAWALDEIEDLGNIEGVPEVGYFVLGATEDDTGMETWRDFDREDIDSAVTCATWVVEQIRDRHFWPPAERVTYDDFAPLAHGRQLADHVRFPAP